MSRHWSLNPPGRGEAAIRKPGSFAPQASQAMREARNLITDNVFGGAVNAEAFFQKTIDASFAVVTQRAAAALPPRLDRKA